MCTRRHRNQGQEEGRQRPSASTGSSRDRPWCGRCVRFAPNARHAPIEGGLVTQEPVGHALALSGLLTVLTQKLARMFTAARLGEVDPVSTDVSSARNPAWRSSLADSASTTGCNCEPHSCTWSCRSSRPSRSQRSVHELMDTILADPNVGFKMTSLLPSSSRPCQRLPQSH